MHVIATAGHVDHGKSTLVRALTGTDPDRLEEERRRGLSIQLGYCWTGLPEVGQVAFVDVPGHERFVATMLSGIGSVPAVLFVVAADDPWMPQATEHLAALDALGVSRGVLAVTRSDLADPAPALARARAELARTSLRDAPAVAVSGHTGTGLEELRGHLVELVRSLPAPDPAADVRLWLDRSFHVNGAGTVVTGTLPAGRISVGDTLEVGAPGTGAVRVRGVQALGEPVESAVGVARVALNLTGPGVESLDRDGVLVAPDAWRFTDVVDVRLAAGAGPSGPGRRTAGNSARLNGENSAPQRGKGRVSTGVPGEGLLHIGATAVGVRCRPLDRGHARLTLERPLPLRIGDRALLRDPGNRAVWGLTVLDPAPAPLRRRGAATALARDLAGLDGTPTLDRELARRGQVQLSTLSRLGVDVRDADRAGVVAGDWLLSPAHAEELRGRLTELVTVHDREHPMEHGIPVAAVAQSLGLPTRDLVAPLVSGQLRVVDGRVTGGRAAVLPDGLERALAALEDDLAGAPFAAPTADRLRELHLDTRAVAAAARAGRLLRVADGIVLLPGADELAVTWLEELPQPFTTSQARVRLGTSRRVVLPLLDHLDRSGRTRRLPDDRRTLLPRTEGVGR
ncbi:MAG TPA: SelB C-terminal domain-containing protein [Nocardioidaceae bacterium]|nr:SelB C-terminal domain-containing protein [Nocardioidaceae bacterium]